MMRRMPIAVMTAPLLAIAVPVAGARAAPDAALPPALPPALPTALSAALATAPKGTRIALVVTDDSGREIVAIRPDDRLIPASNTKMFTTAAAMAYLADAPGGGASVRLEGRDVVLTGHGDARLSAADDCTVDCLADLAKAVAAKTRTVRDVIGDDTAFPDERWPAGMSWNNMVGEYGTAVSALTLDDNVTALTVRPGAPGAAPVVTGDGYFRIENRAVTVAAGAKPDLDLTRTPGSDVLTVTGVVPADAAERRVLAGIDDPAHRAAWRLRRMLEAAGVRVTGTVTARHRALSRTDDPKLRGGAPVERAAEPPALATLTPAPLIDDVRLTNKVSQNLHAELFLRRVALATAGTGSVADGRAAVRAMLDRAGVDPLSYDFADGSGMSTYNRISPRAAIGLLRWTQTQPWGAAWRATLPVGGRDGTLKRRFAGTALEGRLFAKTGTLNAANALSGFMTTASGRTLLFSAIANDMPGDVSATGVIDKALLAVAAAN